MLTQLAKYRPHVNGCNSIEINGIAPAFTRPDLALYPIFPCTLQDVGAEETGIISHNLFGLPVSIAHRRSLTFLFLI